MVYTFESIASAGCGYLCDNISEVTDKRKRLSFETRILSDKLESMGVPAFDETQTVFAIGEVTGTVEQINGRYRHIQLLPEVAQKDRANMVRSLTYFIENHHARRFFRYAVLTAGERCEYGGDLKAKRRKHYANIRRWSSEIRERFGIILLYRGAEFTFSDEGVHDHDNVIYWPTRALHGQEWQDFLSFTRQRLGGVWWKDNGRLTDVREVVKYICKLSSDGSDSESYGIDELSDVNLRWFHEQTYRSKLSQPLGPFADFLGELEREREKIARLRLSGGVVKLVRMKKEPVRKKSDKATATGNRDAENVVLSRTLPFASRSGVIESHSLVLGYTQAPKTLCGKSGLHLIQCNQRQAQGWAEANGYIVHNSTPSVQAVRVVNIDRTEAVSDFRPQDRAEAIRRHQKARRMQQEAHRLHEWRKQWRKASRDNLKRLATQQSNGKQTFKRPAPRVLPSGQGLSLVIASGVGFRP